jgi:hypothetical protein
MMAGGISLARNDCLKRWSAVIPELENKEPQGWSIGTSVGLTIGLLAAYCCLSSAWGLLQFSIHPPPSLPADDRHAIRALVGTIIIGAATTLASIYYLMGRRAACTCLVLAAVAILLSFAAVTH